MTTRPDIARAVEVLRAGGLVALPTETVYGLGADASNEVAVRRIFAAKGRPASHPLIVHLPGLDAARAWAAPLPPMGLALARAFWPGPLTLIVPRSPLATDAVTGGQPTVGLRVPSHPLALELLEAFGGGIAAPSANRFGQVSPTTAAHVRDSLGDGVDCILDGGPARVGVESTIVDVSGDAPHLLRPGGVSREAIEDVLGRPLLEADGAVRAPGSLPSHYAPRAGLRLVPVDALEAEATRLTEEGLRVVALCPAGARLPPSVARLEVPADAEGYARVLYARLREADALGDVIVAAPPAEAGLGLAVKDRLERAAAPRR